MSATFAFFGPDFAFISFERHVEACADCAPIYAKQLAWEGSGQKPGPLCPMGESLWRGYLMPDSADSVMSPSSAPAEQSAGDQALASMPKDVAMALARCARCPRLPDAGYRTCGRCRSVYGERQRKLRERWRREKACGRCGEDPGGDGWCERCRAWATGFYRKIRANGDCAKCWKKNPDPERAYCPDCRALDAEKKRLRRAAARASGLCYDCGRTPPESGSGRCRVCIDKGNAQTRAYGKASRAAKSAPRPPLSLSCLGGAATDRVA